MPRHLHCPIHLVYVGASIRQKMVVPAECARTRVLAVVLTQVTRSALARNHGLT